MDQLTKFLVYNKMPVSKNSMNYEAMKSVKKESEKSGEIDKRFLLLSPDLEKMSDGKYICYYFTNSFMFFPT